MARDVILSAAVGYGLDAVFDLIRTRDRQCPGARLVLIGLQDAPPRNVEVWPYWYDDRQAGPLAVVCGRWWSYREWFRHNDARHVLLCDSRDVIMQGDPFAWHVPYIAAYFECESQRLGTCPYNAKWLDAWYPTAHHLPDRRIACAGTIMGQSDGIRHYVDLMIAELSRLRPGRCLGPDQAAHNYLTYSGVLTESQRFRLWHGACANVGYVPRNTLPLDQHGWVVNADGSIPAVLHQYDRHKQQVGKLAALQ